jgi:hypothetical protein
VVAAVAVAVAAEHKLAVAMTFPGGRFLSLSQAVRKPAAAAPFRVVRTSAAAAMPSLVVRTSAAAASFLAVRTSAAAAGIPCPAATSSEAASTAAVRTFAAVASSVVANTSPVGTYRGSVAVHWAVDSNSYFIYFFFFFLSKICFVKYRYLRELKIFRFVISAEVKKCVLSLSPDLCFIH